MKNLFLGGLARCRRWCGYSNHSGFNSENRNFQVNFKLYLFINTIKYFKHMVNWNIELRNCHPYTPIYGFSLIDNVWIHSLHMEFLEKSFVFCKTYVFVEILVRMIVSSDRGRPEEVRRHGIKLRKPVCETLFNKSLVVMAFIF